MHSRDIELAARVVAGDADAFGEFFESLFPRLYRFALARLDGDPVVAEDVVQETLSLVVRGLHTYRGEAPLFSWCCTICRRRIGDHRSRTSRRPALSLEEDTPEIRGVLDSLESLDMEVPEQAALRNERARLVHVVLDHLPEPYGTALRWKYLEERSVKEIAERLGRSPKAAESVLTRARVAFKDGFSALGLDRENQDLAAIPE